MSRSEYVAIKMDPNAIPSRSSPPFPYNEGPTSPATPMRRELSATNSSSQHATPAIPDLMDAESTPAKILPVVNNKSKSLQGGPSSLRYDEGIRNVFSSSMTAGRYSRGDSVGDNLFANPHNAVRKASSMGYDMLGEDMREMVTTINQLRAKGIEGLGLPLPRIAVIGNQSAGKSSLIEAISGIRVPRFAGTCTRCPLEITLTEDPSPCAPWTCQISLRFHKTYDPKKKGDPWRDTTHHQNPFLTVRNPEHVETALIRAQLAILNPSRHWGEFINIPITYTGPALASGETTEVPFSPNVICMEITGHGIPNLSFIDLPGIIHVTERKEDEYLIKLVRTLVESYIKQEDCLILLAMTMKDDAVNQSAAQMARRLGPHRTIGALTKPDTVLEGEHDQWVRILRGREHYLQHGYFVTKQPSQQQLNERISHDEARKHEDIFFNNMEPWRTELADMSDRFGTINLQKFLSKQLASLIRMRLPAIIQSVQNQSLQVQLQLDRLPPPPANNLRLVLRRLLDDYFYHIRETIDARSDNNDFSYKWRQIAKQLKSGLIALRPRVNPDETAARSANSPFVNGGNLFGSFSSSSTTGSSKSRKRPASSDDPPDESSDPFRQSSAGPARKKIAVEQPRKKVISVDEDEVVETESIADVSEAGSKPMHLQEIREVLETSTTTGIPQIVDTKAVEILSKMHVRMWESPVQNFISSLDSLLHAHVHNILHIVFARYEHSPLYAEMTTIINNFHETMMTKIRKSVEKCFAIEAECIYTLQDKEWNREYLYWKQDNDTRRKRALDEQRVLKQQRIQERHVQSGRKGKVEIPEREGPDPYQRELDTMTNAQAYVSIARKRFGDTVMMRMIRGVFTRYTTSGTFREFLDGEMKFMDMGEEEQERKCRELMVEDPGKEMMRNALIRQQELLENALKDLQPFQQMDGR
ncbi:hypothetical protein H072_2246 [Dactylellina haptotyla CBS 200.50]|uniref:GED domain-containing protein n=1 Tax=Dactylellina haptotyla (strain CBS 200.50) TaxID=1284197 RepID=S8C7P0_DACHA|nr:hypothetical protein H072_2246 [Dactylellina haptotyla CBS 200.50]